MRLPMRPIPCTIGQVHLLVYYINLLYKAEMTSVRLTVTSIAQWFMRGSTWYLVYVELWYLACECMFYKVSKSPLLGTRALQRHCCRSFCHHFRSRKVLKSV